MDVLAATAEPYGAYHLAALDRSVVQGAGLRLAHWLPGVGDTQRPGWVPTTRRTDLAGVDLLLVCGGSASPWTASAAAAAHLQGVPVAYLEVAWPAAAPGFGVPLAAAACGSPATRDVVGDLTGVPPVPLGRFQLAAAGRAPAHPAGSAPVALLLPIVSAETPDHQQGLRTAAGELASAGWRLHVATHPRCRDGSWRELAHDVSAVPADQQMASADLVVGTSTSRMLQAVACGVPVLRVSCGRADVDEHPLMAACGPMVTPTGVVAAAERAAVPNPATRDWLLGPADPTRRLVDWVRDVLA